MREYFAQRIGQGLSQYDRLCRLIDAVLDPGGLKFIYSPGATADARETFRQRRGNCVSYAFLILAVAREFGFEARFQALDHDARWERFGDVIIAARHLDVRITLDDGMYVIDPEPEVANSHWDAMRLVSDDTAFAQFYNNVGVEHLVEGDRAEARHYLELATRVDPKYAPGWSNLGTLDAREGRLPAAKAAFQHSLKLNSRGEAAVDGLVTVLRRLGTPEDLKEAEKLDRRAHAIRQRNPYYVQAEAVQARDEGDLKRAEKLFRRAIRLKDDEPEFQLQWIEVLERLGRMDEARRATAKLDQLRARLGDRPLKAAPHSR